MVALSVIALVSGGKDSFLALYHCLIQGHQVVAIANLHPSGPEQDSLSQLASTNPSSDECPVSAQNGEAESYMFQTAGHDLVTLYAEALTIPVYRAPIVGAACDQAKEYRGLQASNLASDAESDAPNARAEDETESLLPLLQRVKNAHSEANALSAGAILSTYQRTRVESVATRLDLVPLAYLWQWPALPFSGRPASFEISGKPWTPAQVNALRLLDDVVALGLDARLVKVASEGLDAEMLGLSLRERAARRRLVNKMAKFGAAAIVGEGGEFETLVLEGPAPLWKGRIVEGESFVRRGSGGECWLEFKKARVEPLNQREPDAGEETLSQPELWGEIIAKFDQKASEEENRSAVSTTTAVYQSTATDELSPETQWKPQIIVTPLSSTVELINLHSFSLKASIEFQTDDVCRLLSDSLAEHQLPVDALLATTVLLRSMADFPTFNAHYGQMFRRPLPPARVTVACGAKLPPGCRLLLSATASRLPPAHRSGLHVQSRSYWAPANIGPYSQAISLRTTVNMFKHNTKGEDDAPTLEDSKVVFVAGQIPLVPATMELLPDGSGRAITKLRRQAQLALQHLWAVGIAMDVSWWMYGVAYIARGTIPVNQHDQALMASHLWAAAHSSRSETAAGGDPSDETATSMEEGDGESRGPDLWDQQFGSARETFTLPGVDRPHQLPNFDSLGEHRDIPGLLVVEVDELPRSASVEWHSLGAVGRQATSSSGHSAPKWVSHTCKGLGLYDWVQCHAYDLCEGWETSATTFLKYSGYEISNDFTVSARLTVYTPFPALFDGFQAQIIPCRRLWASHGRELAAAFIIRAEPV